MRPYQNLVKEGKSDVQFFKDQLHMFQSKMAVRSFSNLELCSTIEQTIQCLSDIIKECKKHQKHLERMESIEYKSYIAELKENREDVDGEEKRAGTADKKPIIVKRNFAWSTEG